MKEKENIMERVDMFHEVVVTSMATGPEGFSVPES